MPKGQYVLIPMIVENNLIGLISTTADIVERFNIPDTVTKFEIPTERRKRKAHVRRIYDNLNDTASEGTTNVAEVFKDYDPTKNRKNSGKKIKLPTGLRSVPVSVTGAAATAANAGTMRMATFNFPNRASNYQIARWITVNIPAARRPDYFITPAGVSRRTNVAESAGQTSGESGGGETTP